VPRHLVVESLQADYHKAVIRKSQLTKTQLGAMPDDTEAYRTVGRMCVAARTFRHSRTFGRFVREPIAESIASLSKSIAESEETIAKAEVGARHL